MFFIYHSEHYGLIFREYHIILQVSSFFILCTFPFFRKYSVHVCYIFNVIWRIHLMTAGLNAVWSNDRAAHTDTNPKNLELAPPQSVTSTRLDQLVYKPYCYIQIFYSTFFARSEDRTPKRSLEVKVQHAYRLCYGCYMQSSNALLVLRIWKPSLISILTALYSALLLWRLYWSIDINHSDRFLVVYRHSRFNSSPVNVEFIVFYSRFLHEFRVEKHFLSVIFNIYINLLLIIY